MFRSTASRTLLRAPIVPRQIRIAQARRFVSTEGQGPATPTARKSRSWKSTVLRWGLAAGAVYYYNTSTVFAEEPVFALQKPQYNDYDEEEDPNLPTLDSITPKSRQQRQQSQSASLKALESKQDDGSNNQLAAPSTIIAKDDEAKATVSNPEEGEQLEEGDSPEGAFNPETGEINWDCPCLGGMAHGPCGEEFKSAFSCFVFSEEDPKGMDCIDKFKGMQDCFRLHPDIYGSELNEDEVDEQLEEQRVALESSEPGFESKPAARANPASGEQQQPTVKEEGKPEPKDDTTAKPGEEDKETK